MNGHYVFPGHGPPPSVPFFAQHGPSFFVPPHAQYNPNPTPGNGAYPVFHYPHPPIHPPGAYPPPQQYQPYMKPPAPNVHPDGQGWYSSSQQQQHSQQHRAPAPNLTGAPQHPPGLPVPPATLPPDNTMSDDAEVHEYWRGRLAPAPGCRSNPLLLPMREVKFEYSYMRAPALEEEKKDMMTMLLPPTSFFGAGYKGAPTLSPNIPLTPLKTEKKEETQKLDKYADSFVPKHLINIQRETHILKPLPALPIFPPTTYLESFLIPRLTDEYMKSSTSRPLLSLPPISANKKPLPLEAATYRDHWVDVLRWELDAITQKKEEIVLWQLGVKVVSWKDAEFALEVPGIRENHPYLEIGDLVHMREVLVDGKRAAREARVVALKKRRGQVHISSPPLKEHIQAFVKLAPHIKTENGFAVFGPDDDVPFRFNISFMMNSRALCRMEAAATTVAKVLNSEEPGTNLARQWIFPEPKDFLDAPSRKWPDDVKDDQWLDVGLNAEQRLAARSVALYQLPVPHLISGPPGTGKTRTVVEAVLQIFRIQPESCILLCAPSNPATDTLVLRLKDHLLQHEMFRLNDPNRTFAEVPDVVRQYCCVENGVFSIPPWKKLMQYRVIVCSCLDASILVGAQCTNMTLMKMEEEVTAAVHPHKKPKHVAQPHWTHLLIDEAAQGSEPELLIPISVVLPRVYAKQTKAFMPQLTLCGDINQLGPLVASDEARAAELELSLLERLFQRELYSKFSTLNGPSYAKPKQTPSPRLPPYTHLVKNYRSHPAILMPPSAIFYNDSLRPCAKNGTVSWEGLPNQSLPLKFIGDVSAEESTDERASWFNPGQISAVVDVVKSLLADPRASNPPLRPGEIGVMAPWREQVWKLRERLRKEGLHAVDVGTVEDYQGRESRVVIISCVRSDPRFLEEDCKKGLGFVFERKRMNVAITRAKELLVVIGNGSLLQRDPYWKSFLQFVVRNKLYDGPKLSLEMDGSYISRLESALILSKNRKSDLDDEEHGEVVAAAVAREVLRE